jgi:hypothetical protein
LAFAISMPRRTRFRAHPESRFRADGQTIDIPIFHQNTNAGYVPMNRLVAAADLAAPSQSAKRSSLPLGQEREFSMQRP